MAHEVRKARSAGAVGSSGAEGDGGTGNVVERQRVMGWQGVMGAGVLTSRLVEVLTWGCRPLRFQRGVAGAEVSARSGRALRFQQGGRPLRFQRDVAGR